MKKGKSLQLQKISYEILYNVFRWYNRGPRFEVPPAFQSRAMELIHETGPLSPGAVGLIMEAKIRREQKFNKEEKDYVRCLIYNKFVSHGYDSPEDMMEGEPAMVEAMNADSREIRAEKRQQLESAAQEKALKFACAILELQQQGITDDNATHTFKRLDSIHRKVVHELVTCNNRTSAPELPRLKSQSEHRTNYGTANLVLSVAK